ncbi:hypothetical protein ACOMHN_063735 [Nucella lapillus]
MCVQSTRNLLVLVLAVVLVACQVKGYTSSSHSRTPQRTAVGAADDLSPAQQGQPTHQEEGEALEEEEEGRRRGERCEEGWLHTHHHCLWDTGLGAGRHAQAVCRQHGAQEARGVCVKQAPVPDLSSLDPTMTEDEEEEEGDQKISSLTSYPGSQASFVCPSGWTQYEDFCFFRPGSIPKICSLLGANYIFNYCVTRVPQKLPVDFMRAVKRLDGSDYDFHRDTRLCCCSGRRLCK